MTFGGAVSSISAHPKVDAVTGEMMIFDSSKSIGLGYIGLPLVQAFIQAGFRVLGFDVDARKAQRLLAGESYIRHIPSD